MFPDLNFLLTQYCSDILLLEAIRQILPRRTSVRTSAELLGPQEEQRLYDEGEELLHETVDWVFDIMRFREWKKGSMTNRAAKKSGDRSTELTVLTVPFLKLALEYSASRRIVISRVGGI